MYKIAAVGDKDSVYGFASIGLDIFPAEDSKSAAQTLKKLSEEKYAIIYLTEALAEELDTELNKYRDKPTPAIILIPGVSGNTGKGLKNISVTVEQAVGSDILK